MALATIVPASKPSLQRTSLSGLRVLLFSPLVKERPSSNLLKPENPTVAGQHRETQLQTPSSGTNF